VTGDVVGGIRVLSEDWKVCQKTLIYLLEQQKEEKKKTAIVSLER
jgi:hypothetical protein